VLAGGLRTLLRSAPATPERGRLRGLLRTCAGSSIRDARIDIVRVKPRFAERVNLEDDDTDTGVAPFVCAERSRRRKPS
jgi:hypothetical protein